MAVEEMQNFFRLANIDIKKVDNNKFQEPHSMYEDYYELRLFNEKGEICYVTQEKGNNVEIICTFGSNEKAISFFTLFMLSKIKWSMERKEDVYAKKLMKDVSDDQIKFILKDFQIGIDFEFKEDISIDINFINGDVSYVIHINKYGKKIFSVETTNRVRAQLLFLEYLYMNLEIKELLYEAANLGVYNKKLSCEEYYMYFNPYEYMRVHRLEEET